MVQTWFLCPALAGLGHTKICLPLPPSAGIKAYIIPYPVIVLFYSPVKQSLLFTLGSTASVGQHCREPYAIVQDTPETG